VLTESAIRERQWGSFPALRQVLEAKRPSVRHHGLASVSDNIFERLQRLVQVASLADEHREELFTAGRKSREIGERMAQELWELRRELETLRHAFDREIDVLGKLCEEVHRASQGGERDA